MYLWERGGISDTAVLWSALSLKSLRWDSLSENNDNLSFESVLISSDTLLRNWGGQPPVLDLYCYTGIWFRIQQLGVRLGDSTLSWKPWSRQVGQWSTGPPRSESSLSCSPYTRYLPFLYARSKPSASLSDFHNYFGVFYQV